MKLLKAIEILELNIHEAGKKMPPDVLDALKLHVEAMRRLITMRSYGINQALLPLKGENPIPDLAPSADRKQRLRESPLGTEPKVR